MTVAKLRTGLDLPLSTVAIAKWAAYIQYANAQRAAAAEKSRQQGDVKDQMRRR